MKACIKQTVTMLLAAGIGFAVAGAAYSAESLQNLMKRSNLSQQNMLYASKTYVPTGKRVNEMPSSTFTNGINVTTVEGQSIVVNDFLVQSDGSYVLFGTATSTARSVFITSRYNSTGLLDSKFGTQGIVTTDFNAFSAYGYKVSEDSYGRILAIGSYTPPYTPAYQSPPRGLASVLYNKDGSIDSSLWPRTNGKLMMESPFMPLWGVEALRTNDNGRIFIATEGGPPTLTGDSYSKIFVAKRLDNANPDWSFGGGGQVEIDFGVPAGAAGGLLLKNGGVLLFGAAREKASVNLDMAFARLNKDGSLDKKFSNDGLLTIDFLGGTDGILCAVEQGDGKVVAAGTVTKDSKLGVVVVRLNEDGTLDSSFGNSGVAVFFSAGDSEALGVHLNKDGSLLISGYATNQKKADFLIIKLDRNGLLDTTFGQKGIVTVDIENGSDMASGAYQLPDGKIIIGGETTSESGAGSFVLVRLNSDGSLDESFNGNGTTYTLTLSATGSGSGSLASSIGDLNCGSTAGTTSGTCSANFASGTTVTLTAAPAVGNTFTGWSGACSGSSVTCTLTMDAAKSVTASFSSAVSSSRYSKIANNGATLPDSAVLGSGATDWACTRDNTSGLLWEVKTADGGLRDMNKAYTNYDNPTQAQKWNGSGYVNPTQAEIDAATNSIGLVNAVNGTTLCGYREWKMPSKDELFALVDTSHLPTINPTFFPNTPSSSFWSSSPDAYYSYYAWDVYFSNGGVYNHGRGDFYKVRLVRSGQSIGTFALSLSAAGAGSGTLTSNTGGLNCTSTAGTTAGTCSASLAGGTAVTLTATPATGNTFTGWGGACSGSSTTCTLTMDAAKSVTASFNIGALSSQTITFGVAPTITVGGTGSVSATATSGLPVTFSSLTTSTCTVSGSTVSGVAAGICTLAANQSGNSSFSPAPQVTSSFSIAASIVPPGAPTITSIKAGSGSATITFTAPSNTGGSPISGYTATCTATGQTTQTANGAASPLTVKNLSGGVLYQCSLTATNGGGLSSSASATQPVTPVAGKSGMTPILMLLLD